MKASELVDKNHLKALVYGASGVGKTCLAAQLPGPIEYWDFDGKISSAVKFLPSLGKKDLLEGIDVYQFSKLKVREKIPAFEKRTKLIDDLVKAGSPLPFKTLVIDSITTLSNDLMEDYIYRSQPGIKRPLEGCNSQQDYMLYDKHMTRLLTGILSLDVNVMILAHVDVEKDELSGQIERKPLVVGKALAPKLPVWFEEVFVAMAKPDGSRVLLTQPQNGYMARCQRGLPKEIPMKVEEIFK